MVMELKLIEGIEESLGGVSLLKNVRTRRRSDDARLFVPDDGHGSDLGQKPTPRSTFQ